jgi:hypothetical protein
LAGELRYLAGELRYLAGELRYLADKNVEISKVYHLMSGSVKSRIQ